MFHSSQGMKEVNLANKEEVWRLKLECKNNNFFEIHYQSFKLEITEMSFWNGTKVISDLLSRNSIPFFFLILFLPCQSYRRLLFSPVKPTDENRQSWLKPQNLEFRYRCVFTTHARGSAINPFPRNSTSNKWDECTNFVNVAAVTIWRGFEETWGKSVKLRMKLKIFPNGVVLSSYYKVNVPTLYFKVLYRVRLGISTLRWQREISIGNQ